MSLKKLNTKKKVGLKNIKSLVSNKLNINKFKIGTANIIENTNIAHVISYEVADIHFVCYDFNMLKEILEITGFYDIKIYDPFNFLSKEQDDYSKAYLPHLDFENGTCMSLNIVCKKEKKIDKTNIKLTDNIKKFCKI